MVYQKIQEPIQGEKYGLSNGQQEWLLIPAAMNKSTLRFSGSWMFCQNRPWQLSWHTDSKGLISQIIQEPLTSDYSSCLWFGWNGKKIMNISIKLINLPVYFTLVLNLTQIMLSDFQLNQLICSFLNHGSLKSICFISETVANICKYCINGLLFNFD